MLAEATAIPVNPNKAATSATMKKIKAQFNMVQPPVPGTVQVNSQIPLPLEFPGRGGLDCEETAVHVKGGMKFLPEVLCL